MKTLPWILSIVLLVIIFFQRECRHCPEKHISKTDTLTIIEQGDPRPVLVCSPVPVTREIIKPIYIPGTIDTISILKDYFAKVYYSDTVVNDSALFVVINDSISRNRIIDRQLLIQNRRPTKIIYQPVETITPIQRNKFFVGFSIGANREKFSDISPRVSFIGRNDHLYYLSTNLFTGQPNVSVGMSWKIKLK